MKEFYPTVDYTTHMCRSVYLKNAKQFSWIRYSNEKTHCHFAPMMVNLNYSVMSWSVLAAYFPPITIGYKLLFNFYALCLIVRLI